jgi:ureidoacrylate peracid hydrolase
MLKPRVPFQMLLAPVPAFRLTKENTALVLVDPQHFLTSREQGLGRLAAERGIGREYDEYYAQAEAALRGMARLLSCCRKQGLKVIYTLLNCPDAERSNLSRQLKLSTLPIPVGPPVDEIRPEVAPQAGDLVLPRGTYSPFAGTDLLDVLRAAGIDTLIVAGILADLSVAMLAREAADRDFGVVLAWDASASQTLEWHTLTMTGLVGGLIRVRSVQEVMQMVEGQRS